MNRRLGGRSDIDDIDDLDALDTYDWNDDPWDNSLGVSEVERVRTQTRTAKWFGYGALLLVNLLIVGGGVYGWWYIRQANAPGAVGAPVEFVVPPEGETLRSLSERLEDEGFVENAAFFRDYVGDHDGLLITPGLYRIPTGDHVGNVLSILRTPPGETFEIITFPEGFTLQQMAARLAAKLPNFSAEAFIVAANDTTIPSLFRPAGVTSLEGLLFPATYRVYNNDSERQVIIRMAAQMETVAGVQEEIAAGPTGVAADYTPYQLLIIASMIEREAKTEEDRPMIARVIYNRLAAEMKLQVDATVIYNVPREEYEVEGAIDRLQGVDTPWNTYTRGGLPATPIANPGRASIEAALQPSPNPSPGGSECTGLPAAQCQLLYYVVEDEQGNHAFAVTAEQHQVNVDAAAAAGLL